MKTRFLVVGLGNPGLRYRQTWHNLGFMAVDRLAALYDLKIAKSRFLAKTAEIVRYGQDILLMKPQTYMNLSGDSVRAAADFYRVPPERILVLCDDLDLGFGRLRLRGSGSAGSHNGLRSIERAVGQQYARLRLGMGPRPEGDLKDVVLDRIPNTLAGDVASLLARAADCADVFLRDGLEAAQQAFNQ